MARRRLLAFPLSVAVHVGAAASGIAAWSAASVDAHFARRGVEEVALAAGATTTAAVELAQRAESVRRDRDALLADARRATSEGRLSVGDFLLRAGVIDAREVGRDLDLDELRRLYRARVDGLRDAIAERPVVAATADVFADLSYFGKPGGLMADALVDGGGACEPISQLVASALVDAGQGARTRLVFYGGGDVQHLAPIVRDEAGRRWDLLTGAAPIAGGVEIAPHELVEIYARAHTPSATAGGGSERAEGVERLGFAAGYPQNSDAFGGGLPLFARRAIRDRDEPTAERPMQTWEDCSFSFPVGMLEPPRLTVRLAEAGGATAATRSIDVDLVRVPKPAELERAALLAEHVERTLDPTDPVADRVMALACLSALYEKATIDFSLVGRPDMVEVAAQRLESARDRGSDLVGSLASDAQADAVLGDLGRRFSGRNWIALKLPGGSDLVLDIVAASVAKTPRSWGLMNTIAALVVFPDTRTRAVQIVSSLPYEDRVEVMHEVFHAHDHLPPWSASFPLDASGDDATSREFSAAYGVFHRLAWRLWEGKRPTAEVARELSFDARRAELGEAWVAAFIGYYGDNLLALYQHREGGMAVVGELTELVAAHPHPLLRPLDKRLAFLRDKNRLDVATLAEAFRNR